MFTVSCSSLRFGLFDSACLDSKSSISSGQSRFSTGSHVLSALKILVKNYFFVNAENLTGLYG